MLGCLGPLAATHLPWSLKDEATRIFKMVCSTLRYALLLERDHIPQKAYERFVSRLTSFVPLSHSRASLPRSTQADLDGDGFLNTYELSITMKNPRFVATAMSNMDTDGDGLVSLAEWLISQKATYDKNEVACKTALKMAEKFITTNLYANVPAEEAGAVSPPATRVPTFDATPTIDATPMTPQPKLINQFAALTV